MYAVERAARAICEADPTAPDPDAPILWRGKKAKAWEARQPMAAAAIASMRDLDVAIIDQAAEETDGWDNYYGVSHYDHKQLWELVIDRVLGQVDAFKTTPSGGGAPPNDYQHAMVFVTRWLARLVDGEATEAECISVLRHYPGPWENGRANIPADISDADSHHFLVREGAQHV